MNETVDAARAAVLDRLQPLLAGEHYEAVRALMALEAAIRAEADERVAALLRVLRGFSDDLADAVLRGVQPDDIGDADWEAANETYRAALDAAPEDGDA